MGIFSRLADIINSNLSAILDRAEDPEKLIRLIIQEMEDTLVEVRSSAARTIAEKKGINRRLDRLGEAMDDWERKAELAIAKGRDDLAKGALIEKAKLAEAAKALTDELERLDEALSRNDEDIVKLEAKLVEAKAKQKTIRARHETASNRLKVRRQLYDAKIDDALARFEQIEKKIGRVEGESDAYDLGRKPTLSEEISALATEDAVEAELRALRERVTKRGQAS